MILLAILIQTLVLGIDVLIQFGVPFLHLDDGFLLFLDAKAEFLFVLSLLVIYEFNREDVPQEQLKEIKHCRCLQLAL